MATKNVTVTFSVEYSETDLGYAVYANLRIAGAIVRCERISQFVLNRADAVDLRTTIQQRFADGVTALKCGHDTKTATSIFFNGSR